MECLTALIAVLPLFFIFTGCEFPYAPKRQPDPHVTRSPSGSARGGTVYPVNGTEQGCNPSIAPEGYLNGCMLFLGYNRLSVTVPDSLGGYSLDNITSHDRLTVIDTSNTVRWYLLRSDIYGSGDLQCPEWSTHPDYLACLHGSIGRPYSCYAVRVSDHASLKVSYDNLEEFSTPHLWLPDSADAGGDAGFPAWSTDGLVDSNSVERFFGTRSVKLVYTMPSLTGSLFYVDFSAGKYPDAQRLDKPEGKESWYCASPLISPDGRWVTYHCFINPSAGALYISYIQKLEPGSKPVLVAYEASDPHWWIDPATREPHIVYTVTYGSYFSEYDLTDTRVLEDNLAGCTLRQKISGISEDEIDVSDAPDTLIRLPFKGGLSSDGNYLGTTYKYGYIAELNE